MSSESFFSELPAFTDFVEVTNEAHYQPAPADWSVVITDVIGSTKAIEAGRYKDVNALGVASIVGLRNCLRSLDLPYVFGGDGATILVPNTHRKAVEAALRGVRELARTSFELDMRTSMVSIAELAADGYEVLVGRYRVSEDVCFAMFSGSGLTEAERRVKDPEQGSRYAVSEEGLVHADFTGFECRWQPIPSQHGQIASILIQAKAPERAAAAEVYGSLLRELQTVLGGDGRPVSAPRMQLQGLGGNFDAEAKIRSGSRSGLRFGLRRMIAKISAIIGQALMNSERSALGFPGDVYRGQVVANTDFRKFDDTLRMVVDVGAPQLASIRALLAREHEAGTIVYGIHVADASLMTCAIEAYQGEHVHFVDGADGGYALAAKQLKQQLGLKKG